MREVLLDGNRTEGEVFVVIESERNRVTAEGEGWEFSQVNLWHRKHVTAPWEELIVWADDEWRTPGSEAFEAILGVIAKIVAGEVIDKSP